MYLPPNWATISGVLPAATECAHKSVFDGNFRFSQSTSMWYHAVFEKELYLTMTTKDWGNTFCRNGRSHLSLIKKENGKTEKLINSVFYMTGCLNGWVSHRIRLLFYQDRTKCIWIEWLTNTYWRRQTVHWILKSKTTHFCDRGRRWFLPSCAAPLKVRYQSLRRISRHLSPMGKFVLNNSKQFLFGCKIRLRSL